MRAELCNGESVWLFPCGKKLKQDTHITRQRLVQILKELALKSGIDPRRVSPHVIRHSFATHMLKNNADIRAIQELLGHADISSTQIYTHIANDDLKEMLERYHPLHKK